MSTLAQAFSAVHHTATQKSCSRALAVHSTAASLKIGMHFRLPPHGHESRKQWYRVTKIAMVDHDCTEITGAAISGRKRSITISRNCKILRLLSEDPHLA